MTLQRIQPGLYTLDDAPEKLKGADFDRICQERNIMTVEPGRLLRITRHFVTQEGIEIAEELRQRPPNVEGGTESGWQLMFDTLAAILQ